MFKIKLSKLDAIECMLYVPGLDKKAKVLGSGGESLLYTKMFTVVFYGW